MPSLVELTALFDVLPELPSPAPRRRIPFEAQKELAKTKSTSTASESQALSASAHSFWRNIFPWMPSKALQKINEKPRGINPFAALKAGKKMVVIAAVDAGTTTFFRFSQGAFEEWPMI